jgi:hypothetical protein
MGIRRGKSNKLGEMPVAVLLRPPRISHHVARGFNPRLHGEKTVSFSDLVIK